MNIHLPAILRFTRGTRFWPIPRWWRIKFLMDVLNGCNHTCVCVCAYVFGNNIYIYMYVYTWYTHIEKTVRVNRHAAAADSHSNKEEKTDRYSGKRACNKSGQKHASRGKTIGKSSPGIRLHGIFKWPIFDWHHGLSYRLLSFANRDSWIWSPLHAWLHCWCHLLHSCPAKTSTSCGSHSTEEWYIHIRMIQYMYRIWYVYRIWYIYICVCTH